VSKECHTFDHPADVGLAARADSLGELLEALAEGLADLICLRETVRPAESRTVSVRVERASGQESQPPAGPDHGGQDVEELVHDFLSAVLAEIQERRFLVAAVAVAHATETEAAGELRGEPYDPSRHDIRAEVKAVTYHQLTVEREGSGWAGTVILDL
jgi:SHS2 domain-containing protein